MTDKNTSHHSKETPKNKIDKYLFFNISVRVIQALFLVFMSFLVLFTALGLGIGMGYFAFLVEDTKIPTKVELQQDLGDITQTSKLLYANGTPIADIRSDLRRTNVDSAQISPWLKKAIVATEDEYFYKHHGVVPKAVLRALLSEAIGGSGGGGSTLTQQLVKQQILSSETTFKRKAN
ncbi:MAG TPA: transglycosylase domain-containing protein, partial [Enterococcus columbae]|nr:transglycosylase domain-containing protein [Enterococcus columbae]